MTKELAERIKLLNKTLLPESAAKAVINELLGIIEKQHEALETASGYYAKKSNPPTPKYLVEVLQLSAPLVGLKVGFL